MNSYKVYDTRDGLLAPDKTVDARSPMEAVMCSGHVNVRRDYSGRSGSIVVTGPRGSYVYFGERKKA